MIAYFVQTSLQFVARMSSKVRSTSPSSRLFTAGRRGTALTYLNPACSEKANRTATYMRTQRC
jgi:hypothetical protein